MPITIGSNISALRAQRRLNEGSDTLSRVYERLSSGQRINRASDDAAGLAISDSLNADARVFGQAIKNGSDALSLLSIKESALTEITKITTRVSELAEQSANGVYSTKQRQSMHLEAQALWSEADRIARTTSFNGISVLGPDAQGISIQVGKESASSSRIEITTGFDLWENHYTFNNTLSSAGDYPTIGRAEEALITDFDGDGNADIVASGSSGSTVNTYFGNGDGTFRIGATYAGNSIALSAGDFDKDGDTDVAFLGNAVFRTLTNQGNGAFSLTTYAFVGNGSSTSALSDIDGDGNLDWLYSGIADNIPWVFLGNGNGSFQAGTSYAAGFDFTGAAIGDYNADGRGDLVLSNVAQSVILFGQANGSLSAQVTIAASSLSVRSVDLNHDGALDLVSIDPFSNYSINYGIGDGTFAAQVSITLDSTAAGFSLTDLDGDGQYDFVRNDAAGVLYVNLGNGNGTFKGSVTKDSDLGQSYSAATGDLDNDGIADTVLLGYNAESFGVMLSGSTKQAALPSFSLLDQSSSRSALDQFRNIQQRLASSIGGVGAEQARITTAISSLQSMRINTESARARILDADIAQDAALLTRTQILQHAASAILAQANQQPALALQLLRGG